MSTKTLTISVIVVAAIVGVAFLLVRNVGEEARPDSDSPADSSGFVVRSSAIYVADQAPGQSISVALVRLDGFGFVVIHEDLVETPGAILGASGVLPQGESQNLLPIALSRATSDGETLYAMLHVDNGDGIFDATEDPPVRDSASGEPMMMVVTISANAANPGIVNP